MVIENLGYALESKCRNRNELPCRFIFFAGILHPFPNSFCSNQIKRLFLKRKQPIKKKKTAEAVFFFLFSFFIFLEQ
jgi:hypothetical protein